MIDVEFPLAGWERGEFGVSRTDVPIWPRF